MIEYINFRIFINSRHLCALSLLGIWLWDDFNASIQLAKYEKRFGNKTGFVYAKWERTSGFSNKKKMITAWFGINMVSY